MTRLNPFIAIAAVAVVVGVVAFGAARASASSAPIVIAYAKTCNAGHCVGTLNGVTIDMRVTSFRPSGKAAQLTVTEEITDGEISFTAELNGHSSPAGFIVLNGRVTADSEDFAGAEVHQRSNLMSGGGTPTTVWAGQLQLMPASA